MVVFLQNSRQTSSYPAYHEASGCLRDHGQYASSCYCTEQLVQDPPPSPYRRPRLGRPLLHPLPCLPNTAIFHASKQRTIAGSARDLCTQRPWAVSWVADHSAESGRPCLGGDHGLPVNGGGVRKMEYILGSRRKRGTDQFLKMSTRKLVDSGSVWPFYWRRFRRRPRHESGFRIALTWKTAERKSVNDHNHRHNWARNISDDNHSYS